MQTRFAANDYHNERDGANQWLVRDEQHIKKLNLAEWHVQLGHLRGMSVHVTPAPGEMAKGSWLDTNVFTDIAFETGCGLLQLEERHVYVTSISGAVYQVCQIPLDLTAG